MGRRSWLAGLLAMTIPGLGGQTPRRPDQQSGGGQQAAVAPGSTNVVRARLVIISGANTGEFLYSSSPPAAGTLVASVAPAATTTDPYGNAVVGGGFAVYGTGDPGDYALLADAELLLFPVGAAAAAVVNAGSAGTLTITSSTVGGGDSPAAVELLSANANGGNRQVDIVGDVVQLPAVVSATASGTITFQDNLAVTGTGTFGGDVSVNSVNLNVGNGTSGNINLNPKMATPPNEAAVGAGTATLAQTEAFAHGLYSSMKNRGMIN
jgi:hypothetical protein